MPNGTVYLKPAPGRTVLREGGTVWPAEGENASTASRYVRRRMQDGDLVEASPPRPARKKAADGGET